MSLAAIARRGTSLVVGLMMMLAAAPAALASTAAHPAATAVVLDGGATTLALDPGTAAALTANGISVRPVFPASAGPEGVAFPISRGELDTATLAGTIRHRGGLAFTDGTTTVKVTRFVIDTSTGVLTARVGRFGPSLPLLTLDASGATVDITPERVTLAGVDAALTAEAAAALNAAFGTELFAEGIPVGTATVSATVAG